MRAQRTVQAQPSLQAEGVPRAESTQAHFWVIHQLLGNLKRPVRGNRQLKAILTGVPVDTADAMLSAIGFLSVDKIVVPHVCSVKLARLQISQSLTQHRLLCIQINSRLGIVNHPPPHLNLAPERIANPGVACC